MNIEPFVINCEKNVFTLNDDPMGQSAKDIRIEWEWWFDHLPWDEIPEGTKIIISVHLPDEDK